MTFKILAVFTLVIAIAPCGTHAAMNDSSPHTNKQKNRSLTHQSWLPFGDMA